MFTVPLLTCSKSSTIRREAQNTPVQVIPDIPMNKKKKNITVDELERDQNKTFITTTTMLNSISTSPPEFHTT